MPELPEVQTTVTGLKKVLTKRTITDVWTDLAIKDQKIKQFKETIKDADFFSSFKKEIIDAKVTSVERRAKNILINLNTGKTILVHLKMTGHLLYGEYIYDKKHNTWKVSELEKNDALRDPFNRFIHVVFTLDNGKHLVFCDARKFGKVTLLSTRDAHTTKHLEDIGPEPLDASFTKDVMTERLSQKPQGKIKQVLMDQSIVAGIGNIYSDEILWLVGLHPEEQIKDIPQKYFPLLYKAMKEALSKGIDFGGDSTSDYRNIHGEPGTFQHAHNAYRHTGKPCRKGGCTGTITRMMVGGRSAHYCTSHQKRLVV